MLGHVEIGKSAIQGLIAREEPIGRYRIFKRVSVCAPRSQIDTLAPGVGSLNLKTAAHIPCNLHFQSVEEGIVRPRQDIGAAEGGIDFSPRTYRIGEKIAG